MPGSSPGRARRRPRPWTVLLVTALAAAVAAVIVGLRSPGPTVAAYLVPWDEEPGLASVQDHGEAIDVVSPVWYTPQDDGTLARNQPSDTAPVRQAVEEAGALLIPSVSNFRDGRWDAELIRGIVTDEARMRSHVGHLAGLAEQHGWGGVDLDYEQLAAEDRAAFSSFVSALADRLHADDRRVTVALHAKTTDGGGAAPFQRAQDYRAIGRAADAVRIMAYDHHWAGSGPGPIAPVAWVEDVLAYAVEHIPAEKVVLGIGTYGYDWTDAGGRVVSWEQATDLAERHGADVRWDERSQAPWFTYTDDGGTGHTVWFEDARSAAAKLALADRFGLGGVFLWRLGGEDPDLWQRLG